jgi:hypothetical protein
MTRSWRNESARYWLRTKAGIDPRALAAFRIALGTVLMLDVLTRLRHYRALYTDAGVLPRSAVLAEYGGAYDLLLSLPEPWFPAVSFLVLALAALALTAGYRSRVAALVSLLALITIQMRNPFVLNGGDVLLRILVLWAVFLPLDRVWAISGDDQRRHSDPIVPVATVGVLVQVVLVYVVNATHKLDSEAWRAGEAVAGVFRTEQYTYLLADLFGDALLGTGVLTAATYAWFGLLLLSPLLLLSTGRLRTTLVSLFVAAHVGMLLTLAVGLFPLVSITSLLLLYPPQAWDWFARAGERAGVGARVRRAGVGARLRDTRERVTATAPMVPSPVEGGLRPAVPPRLRQGARTFVLAGLPALILAASLVSAAGAVGLVDQPGATASAVETADVGQDWGMFAPNPPDTTWWIAAPATRADGGSIDAFQGKALNRTSAAHADRMPSFRWRKYFQMLRSAEDGPQRSQFARYLCEQRDVETVELYYGWERLDPGGETERGGETLLAYDCDGPTIQD